MDHVIIVGNQRTSTSTITREMLLKPGEPLGYSARIQTQQRLVALGLFRRVVVDELRHAGEARRDVIIRVEEAPPTTIGYGGGVEGGTRLRPTGESGQAEERFEVAPRGFFEIGRRNLWGKNRAVNLFTRVSLRSRDIVLSGDGVRLEEPAPSSGYGFNEYRVVGTFREPRVFNTRGRRARDRHPRPGDPIELQLREASGARRGGPARCRSDTAWPAAIRTSTPGCSTSDSRKKRSRSSTGYFRRYGCQNSPDPSFATHAATWSIPSEGTFVIVDGEVAPRAIGSEVGFVKTFLQGFAYYRVPAARRVVVALGARLGLAHGLPRPVLRIGADGEPILDDRWGADRRPRAGPAGERTVFRGRRYDGSRILPRSAGDRRDDQSQRLSNRRERPRRPQCRTAERSRRELRRGGFRGRRQCLSSR